MLLFLTLQFACASGHSEKDPERPEVVLVSESSSIEGYYAIIGNRVIKKQKVSFAVEDILGKSGFEAQNKYLEFGDWIRFTSTIDNKEYEFLKMVLFNLDIFGYEGDRVDNPFGKERIQYNLNDSLVANKNVDRLVPGQIPVVLKFSSSELVPYTEFFRNKLYGEEPKRLEGYSGLFYLVPKKMTDELVSQIQAELKQARADGEPIDGDIFGSWHPVENLKDNEIILEYDADSQEYIFQILQWPKDDRSHVGF